ncbi:MAG TPA: hypothetical protein VL285_02260 [Bryobacteraceae bacterium]|jgi:hypothetical protein|nr:hypothetical protein [Bryobacteraceae bacterium]
MRRSLGLILAACATAGLACAQFGGRVGDTVLYMFSTKGAGDISVVPSNTTNAAGTALQIRDPFQQIAEPFGPDFPGESRRLLHTEANDNFMMIVQREGIESEHQQFQEHTRALIIQGILRLLPPGRPPIDAPAGFYSTFPKGVDFGPNVPLLQELSFLWTPFPNFPVILRAPAGLVGPGVPAGQIGIDYVVDLGKFVALIPWVGLRTTYPNVGWPDGVDAKLVEKDNSLGITVREVRIRGGRQTPTFRVNANTHLAVLQGSVQIAPAGGQPTTLTQFQYAFVPNNFAITLANPKKLNVVSTAGQ